MTTGIRVTWAQGADRSLPLPAYESSGAAAADLRANLPEADRPRIELSPGERRLVPTGLHVGIPAGFEMQIRPRSGLALKDGLSLANAPGTIDSDYRGPLGVILVNLGADPVVVEHGQRVAQAVLAPVARARFEIVEALPDTVRGAGGFGSTGRG